MEIPPNNDGAFIKAVLEDDAFDAMIMDVLMSEDEEEEPKQWGGSKEGRAPNKNRNFPKAYAKLVEDYFSGHQSVYNEADFERRFRMSRRLFNIIQETVMGIDPFIQKEDAFGKMGIHPLVKLVACLRCIAYGDAYDREDENLRIGQSTLPPMVRAFSKIMKEQFGPQYLNRTPNKNEREAIFKAMEAKGFPGCLGSWDCKHFVWKNCPMRLAGQHQGHAEGGRRTLILEGISDHRKYLWQVNFGDAGSLNDLNVLDKSSIVGAMLTGDLSLQVTPYNINGKDRDWMYFLVDGIYPAWAIFVTTYSDAIDPKKRHFATQQEKVRKDIECAFGILVQRFHVLQRPLRNWYQEQLTDLVHCCAIMHNMIVEDCFGSLDVPGAQQDPVAVGTSFALFGKSQVTAAEAAANGIDLFSARVAKFGSNMEDSYEHELLKKFFKSIDG